MTWRFPALVSVLVIVRGPKASRVNGMYHTSEHTQFPVNSKEPLTREGSLIYFRSDYESVGQRFESSWAHHIAFRNRYLCEPPMYLPEVAKVGAGFGAGWIAG